MQFINISLQSYIIHIVCFFHEADLIEKDKQYIRDNYKGEISFISVDDLFKKFNKLNADDGYKIMCKFNMYYLESCFQL